MPWLQRMAVRIGGWRCGYHGGNITVMGYGRGGHMRGPPTVTLVVSPPKNKLGNKFIIIQTYLH